MSSTHWTAADLPALDGRTVIVTGANSGVGFGTATAFARAGAHTVLAVRDLDRGAEAARRIGGSNEVRRLDLADLSSVRAFADAWDGEISILVNNAGVAMVPESRTVDGFEMQFGTNHLGHFALTNLLLPHITDRVVTLSSGLHRSGTIDFDDLDFAKRGYNPVKAYARAKLANLLFTPELERRLRRAGSDIRSMAAHPGYAATELGTRDRNKYLVGLVHLAGRILAQTPEQAARPTLFAATQDLPGASYVGPDGRGELHGYPTLVGRSAGASDVRTAQRLWDVSEELTGVAFGLR
ncbi:oxidoreductase [Nocardia carnea]|uniref:oxidoreductase n=1 Tax=Nocardia carnea TaxID=37328 RepID=UPI002453FD78|nr:oxidoreductase [Nocardia carnea]